MLNRSRPWNRLPNRPTLSSLVDGGWVWTASHPGQLSGARLLTPTSTTGASFVGSSLGPALTFADVANAGVSFGQVQPIDNPPITLLLVAQLTARSTYRAVVDQRLGSGAFNSTSIRSNYRTVAKANNSGTLGLYFETGGGFSADSQIDGALHAWVFRKNGFGVGTAAMWRDGVAQTLGEDSGTGTTPNASTEQFRIGNHGDYSGTGFASPDPVLMFLCVPRALSDEACRTLSKQPLLAFSSQRIWVPVSAAGGAITIGGNVGNATAAGTAGQVGVAITVDAATGNATAAGTTAQVGVSIDIAGSVGVATAAGTTAGVAVDVTVAGSVGNAVAAGITGGVDLGGNISIDGNVGAAVAAGVQGLPGVAITVNGTTGNAVAAGVTGDVSLDTQITIAGVVGNAVAAGVQGDVVADEAQSVGGGGDGDGATSKPARRRRYVVRRGNQLLVFADKAQADAVQRAVDKAEAEARQAMDRAKASSNRAARRAKASAQRTADAMLQGLLQDVQPVDVADLREAQALAQVYHQQQVMAEALRLRDYEAAVRLWQELRDEEDDIAALLELA